MVSVLNPHCVFPSVGGKLLPVGVGECCFFHRGAVASSFLSPSLLDCSDQGNKKKNCRIRIIYPKEMCVFCFISFSPHTAVLIKKTYCGESFGTCFNGGGGETVASD